MNAGLLAGSGSVVLCLAAACSGSTAQSEACGSGTRLEQGVCVADSDATGSGGVSGSAGVAGSGAGSGRGGAGASGGADADASAGTGAGASAGSGMVSDANEDSLCVGVRIPLATRDQVDLIWAVDTSASMIEEATAVQETINSIARAVINAGVDAHVVMLAAYPICFGVDGACTPGICVPAPLGSGSCPADGKPPAFFHHQSALVSSNDAARVLVERFPDYRAMLRPSARKHLFVVTDDDSTGTQAGVYADNPARFISDYTNLDPMLADSPALGRVWRLSAMYSFNRCPNAANVGSVWKALADQTGGVHGDLCACTAGQLTCTQAVALWTSQVATKIVADAQGRPDCEWAIPAPPPGQVLHPEDVRLELTDTATGIRTILPRVANAAACDPQQGGFYFDNPASPKTVFACPASCTAVKATPQRELSMVVRCRALL